MMNRNLAYSILEEGGMLSGGAWVWTSTSMTCGDGCCFDEFSTIDESLDSIEVYCDWSNVTEL